MFPGYNDTTWFPLPLDGSQGVYWDVPMPPAHVGSHGMLYPQQNLLSQSGPSGCAELMPMLNAPLAPSEFEYGLFGENQAAGHFSMEYGNNLNGEWVQ